MPPADRRQARGRDTRWRSGRGVVLVANGPGWSLWVPVDLWDRMTDDDRRALVEGQAALLAAATTTSTPTVRPTAAAPTR